MLRTIDKINGIAIQKVTKPDGSVIRYQAIPLDQIGKATAVPFCKLWEVRAYAQANKVQEEA